VQQIGHQLQLEYAGLYHGPMVPDFALLLQIGRTLARSTSRR
jgi:hypothetical protein